MMKRFLFVLFCCTWLYHTSLACDVCGNGSGAIGMGLLTNYRSNFLRLGYFDSRFTSHPRHEYLVKDQFIQLDLSMRYSLGASDRIKLMARLPYGINSRNSQGNEQQTTGLSDLQLTTAYVVVNNRLIGKSSTLHIEGGGGVHLPTGKFDAQIHDQNLPLNFNIGKQSTAYTLVGNAIMMMERYGFVCSANYLYNSTTSDGYRFGQNLLLQAGIFREWSWKTIQFTPSMGVSFEQLGADTYANGHTAADTGGKGFFAVPSVNIRTKNWQYGLSLSAPLSSHYANGEIIAKGNITTSVSYLF